ncbi:transglutaminase-like domain-containing protein [Promicromonospora panici]|uniref:transglutaminase-like domain-containing protein n=1 Tax=Promicromonospora panici TaxID=2219658 RepID=UPI001A93A0DE|nr:transglutaminase-like domain-containing protein [Promicromonospora panici]
MADDELSYSQPGLFTSLDATQLHFIDALPDDPVGICAVAQGLVIQPHDAVAAGIDEDRITEKDIRPTSELLAVLTALDASPLNQARAPEKRVVGTCRHFTVLACTFLRARGILARARCGFGTYFRAGHGYDHWITEYWDTDDQRWVRVDTEHLGKGYVDHLDDLAPGEFLTGGEAWTRHRAGLVDAQRFGVPGTDHAWGPDDCRVRRHDGSRLRPAHRHAGRYLRGRRCAGSGPPVQT